MKRGEEFEVFGLFFQHTRGALSIHYVPLASPHPVCLRDHDIGDSRTTARWGCEGVGVDGDVSGTAQDPEVPVELKSFFGDACSKHSWVYREFRPSMLQLGNHITIA